MKEHCEHWLLQVFILKMMLRHTETEISIVEKQIDLFLVAPMCFVFEDPVHLYFI